MEGGSLASDVRQRVGQGRDPARNQAPVDRTWVRNVHLVNNTVSAGRCQMDGSMRIARSLGILPNLAVYFYHDGGC